MWSKWLETKYLGMYNWYMVELETSNIVKRTVQWSRNSSGVEKNVTNFQRTQLDFIIIRMQAYHRIGQEYHD